MEPWITGYTLKPIYIEMEESVEYELINTTYFKSLRPMSPDRESRLSEVMDLTRQLEQCEAASMPVSQEWQEEVTDRMRNHNVHKVVRAHFSLVYGDSGNVIIDGMSEAIANAKEAEARFYQSAQTRIQYCRMIEAEVRQLEKEMRRKRLAEQAMEARVNTDVEEKSDENKLEEFLEQFSRSECNTRFK